METARILAAPHDRAVEPDAGFLEIKEFKFLNQFTN
jgi:hypothetical protein